MALLASARFLGAPLTKKSIWEFFRIKNWCATLFVAKSVPRPIDGRGEADGGPGCGGREPRSWGSAGPNSGVQRRGDEPRERGRGSPICGVESPSRAPTR